MGPAEVFGRLPELYRVFCRSFAGGTVTSSQNIEVVTVPFPSSSLEPENILLIPGGMGTRSLVEESGYVADLKKLCEGYGHVLTVCTGSALLARTGLLDGRWATTNKIGFAWASSQGPNTRWLKRARWVVDGKYYTSSGVSAGIDMALGFVAELHGRATAIEVARQMEYVWNEDKENDPFFALSSP
jgi:transcriptional regulator GlxA family with amidase domain